MSTPNAVAKFGKRTSDVLRCFDYSTRVKREPEQESDIGDVNTPLHGKRVRGIAERILKLQ